MTRGLPVGYLESEQRFSQIFSISPLASVENLEWKRQTYP
jgi:hypothetical protein